ncbi:unnamed protein product [Trichobilharzia szidati]|nr:unnamed protein product [Trichobilharzia szidati]
MQSSSLHEDDMENETPITKNSKKGDFVYIRMNTPSQLENEYEVGPVLGEGSFGIVYQGLRKADGMKCAIKKISRESSSTSERARLDREISILRHVRHPGIIQLLAVAESPKIIFLITELCEGNSLDYCIKQLPERSGLHEYIVAAIVRQVASALSYLHNRGIVHRDLKPGNIMLLNKVELDYRNVPPVNFKYSPKHQINNKIISDSSIKNDKTKFEHMEIDNDTFSNAGKLVMPTITTTSSSVRNKTIKSTKRVSIHSVQDSSSLDKDEKTSVSCKSFQVNRTFKTNGKIVECEMKYPPRELQTKLIDFGLAVEVRKNEEALANPCGTPLYMAPEVLNGRSYTRQCDLWSLGILMFILLTDQSPFTAHNEEQLIKELNNLNIHEKIQSLDYLTPLCQECLIRLLTIDPAYRSSANELLLDPWLSYYPVYSNFDESVDTADNSTRTSNDTPPQQHQDVHSRLSLTTIHSLVDFSKGSVSVSTSRPASFTRFQPAGTYSTTNVLELMKQYHKELNDCKQENEQSSESEEMT